VATLAIVGAGPRGVGILERLLASAGELLGAEPLVVHLIDPYPPGAGRVWRHDQSPLMRLNSMARDITVWTDETVAMDGPAGPGPTLAQWAEMIGPDGVRGPDGAVAADLTAEARALTPITFASRQLQRAYLAWFFDEVVRRAPGPVDVEVHAERVVAITDAPPAAGDGPGEGPQVVHFQSGGHIEVDAVVLAVGHLDREPTGPEAELATFAARHGVVYVPPSYTADEDLGMLRPGEDVIVRGFGLAFIDLMVLLTEERGGRYDHDGAGVLTYTPSGAEPRLWTGSRRGVPYRAKLTYDLLGGRPVLPRYFTPDTVRATAAAHETLDFRTHIWPLMAKELVGAYYRELALGHPERVTLGFEEFDGRFARAEWASAALVSLLAEAVPAPADRVDLAHLDRPLAGRRFATGQQLEAHIADHIAADLARRADPYFSADLGLFAATLACMGTLPSVLATGQLSNRSRVEDIDGWWWGFFSYYSSGPPPQRLEQLLALHRAGVVRFLGPDMWVAADDARGRWRAGSAAGPTVVEAAALVDARLPRPSVSASRDPLIRDLWARGEAGEEVLADPGASFQWRSGYLTVDRQTMQILDAAGRPHPRRFALGANTSTGRGGAFARPRTNAPAFRQNDRAARDILRLLADLPQPAGLAD
jgi:uncharacterized NAD(P)/FAD-binding protein YdhS